MVGEYDGDHIDLRGASVAGSVTAKAVYREHAPAPSALDALPARAVGFTGRESELGSCWTRSTRPPPVAEWRR